VSPADPTSDFWTGFLPQHQADLVKSGLSREQVAAAGVYSLSDPHKAAELLHWKHAASKYGPFLAFPFRDPATWVTNGYVRLKPDRPRQAKGQRVRYESPVGQQNRAYFPPGVRAALADPAGPLLITEGEKKSLKADQEGFACVGLVGVEGWSKKRKDKSEARELLDDLAAIRWDGRPIFICFDSDIAEKPAVQRAEWRLTEALRAKGAVVRVVRLPPGPPGTDGRPMKQGLDDFLVREGSDALRKLLDDAKPPAPPEDKRPKVFLGPNEHHVVERTLMALREGDDNLYTRGGELVRVVRSARARTLIAMPEAPRIESVPLPNLRLRMCMATRFMVVTRRGENFVEKQVSPPNEIVKGVATLGHFPGVRPLEAVVESPIVRPDGSILQTPGYDAATGLLYLPSAKFPPILDAVSKALALKALELLLDVVCDFPFRSDAHRATWIAGLLTMVGRFAFAGPAPLFLVDGNVRACGKGLLADVAALIALGRDFAKASNTTDDDEMRKIILSIGLAGELAVCLDNVAGALGTPSLDAALTTTTWQGRKLKTNETPRVPLFATWWATGNNVILLADTTRRVAHIRLESAEENPEERTGFKRPDLRAWARQERGKLLTAALSILSGYIQAGRPRHNLKPWGSYEGWSDLVREAVVWLGLPDPGLARLELAREADRDGNALRALLAGWEELDPKSEGLTVAEAAKLLAESPNKYPAMRGALAELFDMPADKPPSPKKLGYKLRQFKGRIAGEKYFQSEDAHGGVHKWRVRKAGNGGDGGNGGDVSLTPYMCATPPTRAYTHGAVRDGSQPSPPSQPSDPPPTSDEAREEYRTPWERSPGEEG
jgi:hypothetical protein